MFKIWTPSLNRNSTILNLCIQLVFSYLNSIVLTCWIVLLACTILYNLQNEAHGHMMLWTLYLVNHLVYHTLNTHILYHIPTLLLSSHFVPQVNFVATLVNFTISSFVFYQMSLLTASLQAMQAILLYNNTASTVCQNLYNRQPWQNTQIIIKHFWAASRQYSILYGHLMHSIANTSLTSFVVPRTKSMQEPCKVLNQHMTLASYLHQLWFYDYDNRTGMWSA